MNYNNIVFVDAHNLPDLWFKFQEKLWNTDDIYQYQVGHGSYPGQLRREFDFAVGRVRHPEIRPLCEIDSAANIPMPTTPDQIETYFKDYIMSDIVPPDTFYTYGERIVPQAMEVIRRYQTWGFRHAKGSISIASPEDITRLRYPDDPNSRASEPCLREITFKTKFYPDEKLWKMNIYVYFRVWDLFGGLPENLGGIQMLNELIVKEVGNDPESGYPLITGEMTVCSPSLNVREQMFENSRNLIGIK